MQRFLIRNRLLLAVLVISAVVGAVCTKLNSAGNLEVAGATTHVLVDDPNVSIVDRRALQRDVSNLQVRAELYGRLITTTPVLEAIGKRAGVPPDQISGVARLTTNVPPPLLQPGSEERASQIRDSRAPFRLELQSLPREPILTIYAEAPSVQAAERLADSAILGLHDYLIELARQQRFPTRELPQLRQLGSARGGVTNGGARVVIAGLTFITAFGLSFVVLLVLTGRPWGPREDDPPRPMARPRLTGRAAADWPRTTRILPWSVAALIAMIWLTPFDKIQLAMSAPVNITLERIVLPIVAVVWLIARTAGPGAAPRLRITRVHVAVGLFVACAFLSVVLDARYLNQTGELTLSLKKLPLLLSYVSLFLIVASSVRRSEVPAFMTYTLVLAVICGLAIIYEHHFKENLFNVWSQKLLPHPFELVANLNGSAFDSIGRRWVTGPTDYGVELVTMLSIALPIGVLGILNSKTRKRQILYGIAVLVLFWAMLATQRKSAFVAPAAVLLTLAFFARRQLLTLAPLCLVIVALTAVIAPRTLHAVISQYVSPNSTHVASVSDRTSDYDAIRPDVWSHLAFGRGYGSYDHSTYRILDSQILSPTIETGVLGLVAYLLIVIELILVARKTASQGDPRWSPPALCGVTAGVAVLVVSTLYDFTAFPHGTCTFLYIAGLVVALVRPGVEPAAPPRPVHDPIFRTHGRALRRATPAGKRVVPSG